MKAWDDNEIINLIRSSAFPNPAHKQALRERLFEPTVELSLDDLSVAAGGAALPEPESWEPWQSGEESGK